MDNARKILTMLTLALGMSIFCGIILLKVETWADKKEAEVKRTLAETDWEGFRYQQTARKVLQEKMK